MGDRVVVDVGNSRISLALFDRGQLRHAEHHPVGDIDGAIETLHELAQHRDSGRIALSSVAPSVRSTMIARLQALGNKVFEVNYQSQRVVKNTYATMGTDRMANAAAAYKMFVNDCAAVVLDLGTATTLTAVDKEGSFAGGLIALGLGKTFGALHNSTEQLPNLQLSENGHVNRSLGFDTADAITKGCLFGHIGMLEHWINLAKGNLGDDTVVIATGGYSTELAPRVRFIDHIEANLTLYGINFIAAAAEVPGDQA